MRKLHQNEIPDPLVSEGEYIEYTANNGMVFHVLAVSSGKSGFCYGCTLFRFKHHGSVVGDDRYICECGPHAENSLCYKGYNSDGGKSYCKFVDMDKIMEDL